jgi:hypothetical protein
MAEIFLLTRGHADHVDKWERSMRSQFFPMKFKKKVTDEGGNVSEVEEVRNIEGQLRPIQLWGYVVPEEFVEPMCNTLGIPTGETWFQQTDEEKAKSKEGNSFRSGVGIKAQLELLRHALRAEKLPSKEELKDKGFWHFPIYRQHINVLGIGYRKDRDIKTPLGEHEGI